MKIFVSYIKTMYRPSYLALCACLSVFAVALTLVAVNMRADVLSNYADIVGKYSYMLEEIMLPTVVLYSLSLVIDLDERRRGG